MLTSSHKAMPDWQWSLRQHYGGKPCTPLHVSCQRFSCTDAGLLDELVSELCQRLSLNAPIVIRAYELMPFYSDFRQEHILKAKIVERNELKIFVDRTNTILGQYGIKPHYPWVSSLVTLRESITVPTAKVAFQKTLFLANRLVISRVISAPEGYNILAERPLYYWAQQQHLGVEQEDAKGLRVSV